MLGAMLLRRFCIPPASENSEKDDGDTGDPLKLLRNELPRLRSWIDKRTVVDFGCGKGHQIAGLLDQGAEYVYGVDMNVHALEAAEQHLSRLGHDRYTLYASLPDIQADCVISQNAMEHFPDPDTTLREMLSIIKPGGLLMITFGPPWYAPYGSHMHFFCKLPWVNLLFPEATVMRVRSEYRRDGAQRYEEVESGLNRMSVARFERLMQNHDIEPEYLRYRCVHGYRWPAHVPILRELLVNHITMVGRISSAEAP